MKDSRIQGVQGSSEMLKNYGIITQKKVGGIADG